MTISSTSSAQMMMASSGTSNRQAQSLTDDQLETISSVLANYDSENLSEADAVEIVEAFQAAGIQPGQALQSAMSSEGFDAKEVGDLAGVGPKGGGGMPPPPPPNEELEESVSSLLETLFETDEDEEDSSTSVSFDDVMDYTTRILQLNESSQTQALEMLNQYSNSDEEYTSEELSNLVKNSLSSILSDSNNYRHVSFYA